MPPGKSRRIEEPPQKVEPPQPRTNSRRTIVLLCRQSFYFRHRTDTGQSPNEARGDEFRGRAHILFYCAPKCL